MRAEILRAGAVRAPAIPPAGEEVTYVLHFHTPYRHAKHYTGKTRDLARRLEEHAAGAGARLTEVLAENGIGFWLAAVYPDGSKVERAIKRAGGAARACPVCWQQLSLPLA